MPPPAPRGKSETVARSLALAQELGPELLAVVFTHHTDADTFDLYRPGETDLATAAEVNRTVAAELAACGVRILVQRADRASFRRWMSTRPDTPESRRAWRDRTGLLRGEAALEALGLEPTTVERPQFGSVPGTIANRLIAAFTDEDGEDFEWLANELLAAGRFGILELAVRKIADSLGDDAADEMVNDLLAVAESGESGPSGWSELVVLPVALAPGDVPDTSPLIESLSGSDLFEVTEEVTFLPGWRSPQALSKLDPSAIRRVLTTMTDWREPDDFVPADTDDLSRNGFGLLIGVRFDWSAPTWEEVAASEASSEPAGDEDGSEDDARIAAFDRWRARFYEASGGCVALALVSPSGVQGEIDDFMQEAREQLEGMPEAELSALKLKG